MEEIAQRMETSDEKKWEEAVSKEEPKGPVEREAPPSTRPGKQEEKSGGHVFLSYSSQQTADVDELRTQLISRGVHCWMAKYDMSGDPADAMASAVENAAAVLICYSESYSASRFCKGEALYSCELGKTIIPVRMEESYKPRGWLGLTITAPLRFDMSSKEKVSQDVENLIQEINKLKSDNSGYGRSIHEHNS